MLRRRDRARRAADPVLRLQLGRLPRGGEEAAIELGLTATCAAVYEHPAIRWLLGGELHPGGAATTRRALALVEPKGGERLLDIACGDGSSALLAARELGLAVTGLESSEALLDEARERAEADGLGERARFVRGDAQSLPFEDGAFDLVLCECSLCLFSDKERAVEEIRRVLRPGGRLALSDVVAKRDRLPPELRGALATLACVGEALSAEELARVLEAAGFGIRAMEVRRDDAARTAARVEDRLRGARVLGSAVPDGLAVGIDDALGLVRLARREIDRWTLAYAVFGAIRR